MGDFYSREELVRARAKWHFAAGPEEVEAAGHQVMALPLEPGFSTSAIIGELLARRP